MYIYIYIYIWLCHSLIVLTSVGIGSASRIDMSADHEYYLS